jgi:hypothetical protein
VCKKNEYFLINFVKLYFGDLVLQVGIERKADNLAPKKSIVAKSKEVKTG